jgi:hypothetical protein
VSWSAPPPWPACGFPAHLDTVPSDERPGRYADRWYRPQPWFTVDRDRAVRDERRRRYGTPDDHLVPEPGTAPCERQARLRAEALRRAAEERRLRFLPGALHSPDLSFPCECPPGCDATAEQWRDVHVTDCPCRCDLA